MPLKIIFSPLGKYRRMRNCRLLSQSCPCQVLEKAFTFHGLGFCSLRLNAPVYLAGALRAAWHFHDANLASVQGRSTASPSLRVSVIANLIHTFRWLLEALVQQNSWAVWLHPSRHSRHFRSHVVKCIVVGVQPWGAAVASSEWVSHLIVTVASSGGSLQYQKKVFRTCTVTTVYI